MINTIEQIIGRDSELEIMKRHLKSAISGRGSIICVTGETGMGKTHLLNYFSDHVRKREADAESILVDGLAPIGKVKIGNIHPLYPFAKAIEKIKEVPPEKKFARNLGMTFLASLPVVDSVFYFVKEAGRDWREFRKDKSSSTAGTVMSSAAKDYYDTICSLASKGTLAVVMDDMHWSDAQSVELLISFAEKIDTLPLLLVLSCKQSVLDKHALPFTTFMANYCAKNKNVTKIELNPFSTREISECLSVCMPGYRKNDEFETWLKEKTFGVPGVLGEYIRYFERYSPFSADGTLIPDFKSKGYMPVSAQSMFAQALELLNDEEKNLLSVCSAEGIEFTVNIVSQLMNLDVLSTIKKLRQIQNKTGVIKSIGAHHKYGMKTTTYRFTQGFYHDFFESKLEYEEYLALHGHIAMILQTKYDEADDDLKETIAPYLAAHSAESGDEDTARNMLLIAARNAGKYGSDAVVNDALSGYNDLGAGFVRKPGEGETGIPLPATAEEEFRKAFGYSPAMTEPAGGQIAGEHYFAQGTEPEEENLFEGAPEFAKVRAIISDHCLGGRFDKAVAVVERCFSNYPDSFLPGEAAQLHAFAAKAYVETGAYSRAEKELEEGTAMLENSPDVLAETLLLNTYAMLKYEEGKTAEAYGYMDRSAKNAMSLPPELRLLTLANIGIMLKSYDSERAPGYIEAALRLAQNLGMSSLQEILKPENHD